MQKAKKNIYNFLRGSFLTDEESAFKNWRVIIFIVGLLLIMITSSHSIDEKTVLVSELNIKNRQLRAEYVDTNTQLMRMKMESSIRNQVKNRGLMPSKTPPQKIKVTTKD